MKRCSKPVLLSALAGLLLLWPGRADAASAELEHLRAFEEANRRFTEAKSADEYYAAAARFQSILDSGLISGAVLYNLGNCWLAVGEHGRAIASYLRAERYLSRDPLLQNNLGQARIAAGQSEPAPSVLDHVLFWQDWLSYREKAWAVALLATLAFLCGLLSLQLGRRSRLFRRAGWSSLALCAIALGSLSLDVYEIEFQEHGVIVKGEVTARMGNSESFAPAFNEPLREGAVFEVLERRDDWVRIQIQNGLDGWVAESDAVYF